MQKKKGGYSCSHPKPFGLKFCLPLDLCKKAPKMPQPEARCFSSGKDGYFVSEGFSRQLPLATAAHNRLTQLQRGGSTASLVSHFSTWLSKPHTGPHRGFSLFGLFVPYLSPTGKGVGVLENGLSQFSGFVHNWLTLAQQGR